MIHLDFTESNYKLLGLEEALEKMIRDEAKTYQITLKEKTNSGRISELILKLRKKYDKQVVLLIDEYDKPIIDFLEKEKIHIAEENRQIMKNFYTPIKSLDNELRFFFLTGVSRFSKVSIFSDLNHLLDITLDARFSSMLGYTQEELENYFADYINLIGEKNKLDKQITLEKLKEWYNGYSWTGEQRVYNPFSVMNAFVKSTFNNYWFETGTPTFLLKLMAENQFYDITEIETDLSSLGAFDVSNIEIVPILFQTGYLTLQEQTEFDLYRLGYPNKEVENSMLKLLLSEFAKREKSQTNTLLIKIKRNFDAHKLDEFFVHLNSLFAKIPYQIFEQHKESYYHSIIFLTFELLGYYTDAEVNTSIGRIDAVVRTQTHIYILEFKVNDSAESALQQIKDRKYYEKYLSEQRKIVLIGISCQEKTITEYLVEEL